MPVSYTYDATENTLECVARGVVAISEVVDFFDAATADDGVGDGAIEVVYLDEVTDFRFSYAEARVIPHKVLALRRAKGVRATVIVAASDLHFGMARMIQIMDSLADPAYPVRIVRGAAQLPETLQGLRSG